MHAQDLLIDESGNRQAVKAVSEGLPKLDVVSALALVVEAIDTVDRGTLMIASEQEKVLGVLDFVSEQEAHGLEGLLATVDVVSQEEVVCIGGEATVFEQSEQVVVLPVNITYKNTISSHLQYFNIYRPKTLKASWKGAYLPQILMGASSSKRMG